jgi:hypothetical protein
MLLTPVIPRSTPADPALDQQQLYAQGLDGVRRLSRRQWTDHNVHDPGITTLELLCYALTELGYRAEYAVEDLLATQAGNAETMAQQFFTPRQILLNRPLTTSDYRKLLIDLDGVKNAWIRAAEHRIYADTIEAELLDKDSGKPGVRPVDIRGRYSVLVEYMDDVTTNAEQQSIDKNILVALNANRTLCEIFTGVSEVGQQFYALCAELELETSADQVEVAAQIRFQIQRYLAPPVHCHSLATMLARTHADGSAYSVAEIFEGPALENGFIDDEELHAAELRSEIRLSDIICIIMDIPGVRAVRDIVVNALVQNEADEWEAVPFENGEPDKWRQLVPDGVQPRLSEEVGRLVFYKRNMPVVADTAKVAARLAQLEDEEKSALEDGHPEDLSIPLGKPRDTVSYYSFQHHFPQIYGLSAQGLSTQDPQRKALVLQLKGYLLFFDQIMANFFAQLGQLRSLYARDYADAYAGNPDTARTCFAQRVESIPGFDKVYGAGTDTAFLQTLIETADAALIRRNRIFDHLLARLGEDFHDYVAVAHSAFGDQPAAHALAKARFIADYPQLGAERSLAYNYTLQGAADLWNSDNVSGLERRLCRLLDISNASRRNLGTVSYDTYAEIDTTPGDEYRFRVKHPVSSKILLSSSTNYATPEAARTEMELAISLAQLPEAYQRKMTAEGKHYFNIVNGSEVIARRIEYFATEDAMEAAISLLITHLREYYSGEGMYLIENILLLPELKDDPFLDICTDPSCTDCSDDDPYSYRLHFILPAYAGRFQNMDFRRFVEETIRQETPAHLLPKVCWVDSDDMAALEGPYRDWIDLRSGKSSANRAARIKALIVALQGVKNVYPQRLLHECSADESKPPFILGRSALGSEGQEEE